MTASNTKRVAALEAERVGKRQLKPTRKTLKNRNASLETMIEPKCLITAGAVCGGAGGGL